MRATFLFGTLCFWFVVFSQNEEIDRLSKLIYEKSSYDEDFLTLTEEICKICNETQNSKACFYCKESHSRIMLNDTVSNENRKQSLRLLKSLFRNKYVINNIDNSMYALNYEISNRYWNLRNADSLIKYGKEALNLSYSNITKVDVSPPKIPTG